MKLLKVASITPLLLLSTNVNSVILNTLNGIDYQWLELSETSGLSRNDVDSLLNDSSSSLFGYKYASRALFQDLLNFYINWDGLSGVHSEFNSINEANNFINVFGSPQFTNTSTVRRERDTHGNVYIFDNTAIVRGMYGLTSECGGERASCQGIVALRSLGDTLETGGGGTLTE